MAIIKTTQEFANLFPNAIQIGGGIFDTGATGKYRLNPNVGGYELVPGTNTAPVDTTPTILTRSPRDVLQTGMDLATSQETQLATQKQAEKEARMNRLNAQLAEIERVSRQNIESIQKQGVSDLAKARGINIRAGLIGSTFGEAARATVEQGTQRQVQTERERAASLKAQAQGTVDEAISQIEERYLTQQQNLEQQKFGLTTKIAELTQADKQNAIANLETLAKSGRISLEKARQQGLFDILADQTGETAKNLENRFIANLKPEDVISKYRVGNSEVITIRNPDGTYSTKQIDFPAGLPPSYDSVEFLKGTGQLVYYSKTDPTQPPKVVSGLPKEAGKTYQTFVDTPEGKYRVVFDEMGNEVAREVVAGTEKKTVIDKSFLSTLFTDAAIDVAFSDEKNKQEMINLAKTAGVEFTWLKTDAGDIKAQKQKIIDYIDKLVQQYRASGMTEEEILRLLQS